MTSTNQNGSDAVEFLAHYGIDMGEFIAHHGIKGQKWGVRRFQNEDGSLTPEGRERYGRGEKTFNANARAELDKEVAGTLGHEKLLKISDRVHKQAVELGSLNKDLEAKIEDIYNRMSDLEDKSWNTKNPGKKDQFYRQMDDVLDEYGAALKQASKGFGYGDNDGPNSYYLQTNVNSAMEMLNYYYNWKFGNKTEFQLFD